MHWIFSPILGGIIGYITNDIAIRMLFHPYNSMYIGKFHVPFTPGLIPQQKNRIALSIGAMISNHLLDGETLQSTLLSEEMLEKLKENVAASLKKFKDDNRTLEQIIFFNSKTQADFSPYIKRCKKTLSDFILKQVTELGFSMSQKIFDGIEKNLGHSMAARLNKLGVIDMLARIINEKIQEKTPEVVYNETDKLESKILSLRLSEIYNSNEEYSTLIADEIINIYHHVIASKLNNVLDAVNISNVIANKINTLDAKELETMIFSVMKRELKAVVYLGAVLGFLMGFVNFIFY